MVDIPLLDVRGLRAYYFLPNACVRAVERVSLSVDKGEIVAVVGESGSGKSTLGLAIIRLLPHPGRIVDGSVIFEGKDLVKISEEEMSRVRGRKISAVFQDPLTSLDPLMRIGDQIVETLMTHFEMEREEAVELAKKYLEMVGIPGERFHDYPHQFSGGMRQRAMIAMAIATKPSLLIADEPTTALDVIVQAQIMQLFSELRKRLGLSIMLITHDIALAMEIADRIAVMYGGQLMEVGSSVEIYEEPLHPYVKLLINSIPVPDPDLRWRDRIVLPKVELSAHIGEVRGCKFYDRCPERIDRCARERPKLTKVDSDRCVACFLYT